MSVLNAQGWLAPAAADQYIAALLELVGDRDPMAILADPGQSLTRFATLRGANLALFETLGPAELAREGLHAERGPESVERMRRLYAGHDLAHVRQLERIARSLQ